MGGFRYFGGAVAFGFAAVWIMASLAAALVCLSAAVVGYGLAFAVEHGRAKRTLPKPRRAPQVEEWPQWAEALNSDLGHIYEPAATTSPLSAETAYGWPVDAAAATSETLH